MAALTEQLSERLRAGLDPLVAAGRLPSAAWTVVSDETRTADGLGGAGPDTVFQVGSVTKPITGLLLAEMAERGEVQLADTAARYLPDPVPSRVTLLDLATQTSGLPRLPRGFLLRYALRSPFDPYARYSERHLLRDARRSLKDAAGEQPYEYSNFGFGLLGYLLGRAEGRPYEALVEERVLAPLGLQGSGFDSVPVQGYHRRKPVPPWHMGVLSGAGGLHSTVTDLGTLLAACLDPASTPLEPVLRSALASRRTIGRRQEIGLAWHHALRGEQRVIWHNGMTGGYSAMVGLNPARHVGVAVLSNDGTDPSPLDDLVFSVLFEKTTQ